MAKMFVAIGLVVTFITLAYGAPQAAPQSAPVSSAPSASGPPVIEPIIDWGKCPQLAPTEMQRKQKTEIIKTCLDANPLNASPDKLTHELVEQHRIKLGECALNKEDWVSSETINPIVHIDNNYLTTSLFLNSSTPTKPTNTTRLKRS